MKNKKEILASTLRTKAEKEFANRELEPEKNLSEGDLLKIIDELQVHKIEIEIQNDELSTSNIKIEYLVAELVRKNKELKLLVDEKEKSATELIEKTRNLEYFNHFFIGRELKMVDLKNEINELLQQSGRMQKYLTIT